MNENQIELFKVNYDSERITLSAREFHEFLEVGTQFKDWFPRMCEYGFVEGVDFNPLKNEQVRLEGYREVKRQLQDYQITIEMAKEIAMLQRNEKGKQARQYFIELEKKWNSPEQVIARGLIASQRVIENLNKVIIEQKPKVEFYDSVTDSKTAIPMDQVAKVLDMGIGRNKLFESLRNKNILQKNNIPYQTYIDRGYFRVIESKYTKPNGDTCINIKTLVYQKGVDYIRKQLAKGAA